MNDDNKKLENKKETIKLSKSSEGDISLQIINKLGSTDDDFLESMVEKFIHASSKGLDLKSVNGSLAALTLKMS